MYDFPKQTLADPRLSLNLILALMTSKMSAAAGHSAAERGGAGQTAGGEQQTPRVPQLFVCERPGEKG